MLTRLTIVALAAGVAGVVETIITGQNQRIIHIQYKDIKSKVVEYSIMSVGHRVDPGFLTVSPQVTLVINPVVGCRYFPSDPWLLSQPKRSPSWPVPNYTVW